MMTTREHFDWAVARAEEYLNRGEAAQGVTSFLSDVRKHPEVQARVPDELALVGLMEASNGADAARRWLRGFPRPELTRADVDQRMRQISRTLNAPERDRMYVALEEEMKAAGLSAGEEIS
jgi:hypothetical protein